MIERLVVVEFGRDREVCRMRVKEREREREKHVYLTYVLRFDLLCPLRKEQSTLGASISSILSIKYGPDLVSHILSASN